MECTRKKSDIVHQTYEIHVSFINSSAFTITSGYERLRFALLASKWCPKLLGILLWSALHVLLVVIGASLMALVLACSIALGLDMYLGSVWVFGLLFPLGLILVCAPCYLIWLLMRLSWALIVCDGERTQQMRVAWRGFEEWWSRCVDTIGTDLKAVLWGTPAREFVGDTVEMLRPCWRLVGKWCTEIMMLHDTIAI